MNRLKRRLRRLSRRQWIIIGLGSALLVGVAGYATYSTAVWTRYQDRAQSFERSSFDTIDAALALSGQDRQRKLTALEDAVMTMQKTTPSLCDRPALVAWQVSLPTISDRYAECEERATHMREVSESADSIVRYLESERQLGVVLSTEQSQSSEEVREDRVKQQVERWSQTRQAIVALSGPDEFTPVKDAAATYAENVSKQWQAVAAADEAEDGQQYVKAKDVLESVYERKSIITDNADKALQQLLKQFDDRYTATH